MGASGGSRIVSRFRSLSEIASLLAFLIGLVVLLHWALEIDLARYILPGESATKANTGLGFCLSALALWLLQARRISARNRRIATGLAAIVGVLGLLSLLEYVLGLDLGIDQILFKDVMHASEMPHAGRMAPNAALNFVAIGISLMILDWETGRGRRPAQYIALVACVGPSVQLLAHVFGDPPFGPTRLFGIYLALGMPVQAALGFLMIFLGVLCARPDCGWMATVTSEGMGRNLVRRLLPVASLTLIGTAGLRVLGERAGLYSEGFGVGIVVLASLMILSALVLAATRSINREEALRREAEQELRRFNAELERRVTERTAHLDVANKELSAFTYSVSHDLRAPLVTIGGFSMALVEDYLQRLDETGQNYVRRIHAEALRMGHLIDDLLRLSRITRAEMKRETVDLSVMAENILAELHEKHPDRQVEVAIPKGLTAQGDLRLLRVALENLLVNAWKFTGNRAKARIEFGATDKDGERVFFVRDDGVGFDMAYAHKLFTPFHRMHPVEDFPGTGIGLVTVQRIIGRHGGRIWAEGATGKGATFYFTL